MNAIAGISGGRTSARMAYMLDPSVVLCFQNTGKEHSKTYEFLERLEQDLGRPIIRLEFRAPVRGAPPKHATFEIVEHRQLARHGEPFVDMLECVRTYRAKHKDMGPVAPWARSRICTAYLKVRTQRKYCATLGWGMTSREYTEYVGFRADEPLRVAKMRGRNDALDTDERAPLFDAGIVKSDVLKFWAGKSFDLEIPEHLGNCTACFLKDERDLADALLVDETEAAWWIAIEETYAPMRRGRPSYRQVLEEAPERVKIRAAMARGEAFETSLSKRRVQLIVKQELAPRSAFSCECDAAKAEDLEDDV